MLTEIDYLVFANIISAFMIIIQKNRLLAFLGTIVWAASWLLVLNNSVIGIDFVKNATQLQYYFGITIIAALVILFITKPVAGFIGIILALPFRIPLEFAHVIIDVRKIFVLIIVSTLLGLLIKNKNRNSRFNLPVGLTFAAISLSYYWAVNHQDALVRYVFFLAPFSLLYKVMSLADLRKQVKTFSVVTLVLALFIASFGIFTSIKPVANNTLPSVAPGWQNSVKAGSARFSLRQGKDYFYQNISALQPPVDALLFQTVKIPKGTKHMKVNGTISAKKINKVVVTLHFYNRSAKNGNKKVKIKTNSAYISEEPAGAWVNFSKKIKVPKKANLVRINIRIKSNQQNATLSVKHLNINTIKIKNPEFNSGGYITRFIKKIRATSIFWDPNVFAKYLVFILLLGVVVLLEIKNFNTLKIVLLVVPAIALSFGALFLTISRSGFLSLLAGLSVLLFSVIALSYNKKQGLMAIFAIIILSVVLLIKPPDFAERLSILGAKPDIEEIMAVSGGRNYLMEAGIKMAADSPVYGLGLGSFSDVYHKYKNPLAKKDLTESHNLFITVFAEQGMVGALLMLWVILFPTCYYWRLIIKRKPRPVFFGSFAILIAFLVNTALYAYFFEDPYTWFMLGILAGTITGENGRYL